MDVKTSKNSLATMVFEFGCLPPVQNESLMIDQIHKCSKFWNKLVEIEREYRAKVGGIIAPQNDIIDELENELVCMRDEIKSRRKSARKKSVEVDDLENKVNELKARLKEERQRVRQQKKEHIKLHKESLDKFEAERRENVKKAQAESGLYWCNYDQVVSSYMLARQKAMKEGRELKYHRFDGAGKVTVRYQTGLPAALVFGNDTRLQIDQVQEAAWTSPVRKERRKASRTTVRIRIGSEGRKPIWLELPLIMHRPLPNDGIIRTVSIVREKLGNKFRYKLIITVVFQVPDVDIAKTGSVGIDVGWRKMKEGLRVACWYDSYGKSGQLVLPESLVSQFIQVDNLKSIRAKHFNDAKNMLKAWTGNKSLPQWLTEKTSYLASWRTPGKLANVVKEWHNNRFAGDQEMIAYLDEWMIRDNHLWTWEFNLRDQIIKHRREIYRIFAADLAKKYRQVYLKKLDLRSISQKPQAEDGTSGVVAADRQKFIASISTLRQILHSTCLKNCTAIGLVDGAHSTLQCIYCKHTEQFNTAKQIQVTCPVCGQVFDQDYAEAKNILETGLSQDAKPE